MLQVKDKNVHRNSSLKPSSLLGSKTIEDEDQSAIKQSIMYITSKGIKFEHGTTPLLNFGTISNRTKQRTAHLRIENELHNNQDLHIDSIPIQQGYKTSKVYFNIPAQSKSSLITVTWNSRYNRNREVKNNNFVTLRWKKKRVKIKLELLDTRLIRGDQENSNPRIQPQKKTKENIQTYKENTEPLGVMEQSQLKNKNAGGKVYQSRLDELQAQIRESHKHLNEWIKGLPINVNSLSIETKRINKKYEKVITEMDNENRIYFDSIDNLVTKAYFHHPKIVTLLTWMQTVCSAQGVYIEEFHFNESPLIMQLIANFYRATTLPIAELYNEPKAALLTRATFNQRFRPHSIPVNSWAKQFSLNRHMLEFHMPNKGEQEMINHFSALSEKLISRTKQEQLMRVVILVQSNIRLHLEKIKYEAIREADEKLNCFLRQVVLRRRYQNQKKSIMKVQTLIRSHQARHRSGLKKQKEHIVAVQSSIRMLNIRNFHQRVLNRICGTQQARASTLKVQQYQSMINNINKVNTCFQRNHQMYRFSEQIQTIVRIQSICRAKTEQQHYQHIIEQIRLIQACACRIPNEKLHLKKIKACQFVQNVMRKNYHHHQWNNTIIRAQDIQCVIRSRFLNNQFFKIKNQVSNIQRQLKMQKCTSTLLHQISQVKNVQHFIRSKRNQTKKYENIQRILTVQNKFAGYAQKLEFKRNMESIHLVQQMIRGRIIQNKYHNSLALKKNNNVTLVQSSLAREANQIEYFHNICLVYMAQCFLKVRLSAVNIRMNLNSIRAVQRVVRSRNSKNTIANQVNHIITIQSKIRQNLARHRFQQELHNLARVQNTISRHLTLSSHQATMQAIQLVQDQSRSNKHGQQLKKMKIIIERSQQCIRMAICSTTRGKQLKITNLLQSCIRQKQQDSLIQKDIQSIVFLQRHVRFMQSNSENFHKIVNATRVQSIVRMLLCKKKHYNHLDSLSLVQNHGQMVLKNENLNHQLQHILGVQSKIRQQLVFQHLQKTKILVQSVQAVSRTMCYSSYHHRILQRMVQVQAHYRMLNTHIDLCYQLAPIYLVQDQLRSTLATNYDMDFFDYQRHHIQQVQNCIRRNLTSQCFDVEIQALCSYQSKIKSYVQSHEYNQKVSSISLCQTFIRAKLARKQHSMDLYYHRAATSIQAVWRGYSSRHFKYHQQYETLQYRLKFVAHELARKHRISEKTNKALRILMNSQKMSHVIKACSVLDELCKHSKGSCDALIGVDAIPTIFQLIISCNRSEPHVRLLEHLLQILIHIVSFPEYRDHVFDSPDSMLILVELLQMYRDYAKLFLRSIQIIRTLIDCNENDFENEPQLLDAQKKRYVQFCLKSQVIQQMTKVLNLLENKYHLELKVQAAQRTKINRELLSTSLSEASRRRMSVTPTTTKALEQLRQSKHQPIIHCFESLSNLIGYVQDLSI